MATNNAKQSSYEQQMFDKYPQHFAALDINSAILLAVHSDNINATKRDVHLFNINNYGHSAGSLRMEKVIPGDEIALYGVVAKEDEDDGTVELRSCRNTYEQYATVLAGIEHWIPPKTKEDEFVDNVINTKALKNIKGSIKQVAEKKGVDFERVGSVGDARFLDFDDENGESIDKYCDEWLWDHFPIDSKDRSQYSIVFLAKTDIMMYISSNVASNTAVGTDYWISPQGAPVLEIPITNKALCVKPNATVYAKYIFNKKTATKTIPALCKVGNETLTNTMNVFVKADQMIELKLHPKHKKIVRMIMHTTHPQMINIPKSQGEYMSGSLTKKRWQVAYNTRRTNNTSKTKLDEYDEECTLPVWTGMVMANNIVYQNEDTLAIVSSENETPKVKHGRNPYFRYKDNGNLNEEPPYSDIAMTLALLVSDQSPYNVETMQEYKKKKKEWSDKSGEKQYFALKPKTNGVVFDLGLNFIQSLIAKKAMNDVALVQEVLKPILMYLCTEEDIVGLRKNAERNICPLCKDYTVNKDGQFCPCFIIALGLAKISKNKVTYNICETALKQLETVHRNEASFDGSLKYNTNTSYHFYNVTNCRLGGHCGTLSVGNRHNESWAQNQYQKYRKNNTKGKQEAADGVTNVTAIYMENMLNHCQHAQLVTSDVATAPKLTPASQCRQYNQKMTSEIDPEKMLDFLIQKACSQSTPKYSRGPVVADARAMDTMVSEGEIWNSLNDMIAKKTKACGKYFAPWTDGCELSANKLELLSNRAFSTINNGYIELSAGIGSKCFTMIEAKVKNSVAVFAKHVGQSVDELDKSAETAFYISDTEKKQRKFKLNTDASTTSNMVQHMAMAKTNTMLCMHVAANGSQKGSDVKPTAQSTLELLNASRGASGIQQITTPISMGNVKLYHPIVTKNRDNVYKQEMKQCEIDLTDIQIRSPLLVNSSSFMFNFMAANMGDSDTVTPDHASGMEDVGAKISHLYSEGLRFKQENLASREGLGAVVDAGYHPISICSTGVLEDEFFTRQNVKMNNFGQHFMSGKNKSVAIKHIIAEITENKTIGGQLIRNFLANTEKSCFAYLKSACRTCDLDGVKEPPLPRVNIMSHTSPVQGMVKLILNKLPANTVGLIHLLLCLFRRYMGTSTTALNFDEISHELAFAIEVSVSFGLLRLPALKYIKNHKTALCGQQFGSRLVTPTWETVSVPHAHMLTGSSMTSYANVKSDGHQNKVNSQGGVNEPIMKDLMRVGMERDDQRGSICLVSAPIKFNPPNYDQIKPQELVDMNCDQLIRFLEDGGANTDKLCEKAFCEYAKMDGNCESAFDLFAQYRKWDEEEMDAFYFTWMTCVWPHICKYAANADMPPTVVAHGSHTVKDPIVGKNKSQNEYGKVSNRKAKEDTPNDDITSEEDNPEKDELEKKYDEIEHRKQAEKKKKENGSELKELRKKPFEKEERKKMVLKKKKGAFEDVDETDEEEMGQRNRKIKRSLNVEECDTIAETDNNDTDDDDDYVTVEKETKGKKIVKKLKNNSPPPKKRRKLSHTDADLDDESSGADSEFEFEAQVW